MNGNLNNAFYKELFRKIKKSISRYLSILLIVALGVGFFAGLKSTSSDMLITGDTYFDSTDMYDIRILSSLGLSTTDIAVISETENVEFIQPAYYTDIIAMVSDNETVSRVHSISESGNLNDFVLVSGHMPEAENECVLLYENSISQKISVGDNINISSESKFTSVKLKNDSYKVTGIVQNPMYISYDKGPSTIGSGNINNVIFMPESNFISNFYTEIYISVSGAKNLDTFGTEYQNLISEVTTKIQDKSQDCLINQKALVVSTSEELIAKAKVQYDLFKESSTGTFNEKFILKLLENQIKSWENQLEKLTDGEWFVLNRNTNIGYTSFQNDSKNINAIASVFPVLFFLVAALVCLTTMTRMVEEERTQIGIYKALGYSSFKIALKYLFYAFSATLLGSILGLSIGFKLFPNVIFNAYRILYNLPNVIAVFNLKYAVISSLTAILCTLFATLFSCLHMLREWPSALLLPKPPTAGKRIFLEYIHPLWKRFGFFQKVTARNIFRFMKRFFMTVIGIAGCTALLLTGFGLKDSINDVVSKQFNDVLLYNFYGTFRDSESAFEKKSAVNIFSNTENISNYSKYYEKTTDVYFKDKTINSRICVLENFDEIELYFSFQDRVSKEKIKLTNDDVIITEKLAKLLKISVGDSIEIMNNGSLYTLKVSGICENYIYHYIYVSPSLYENVFGEEPPYNGFLGILTEEGIENRDDIFSEILKINNFTSVGSTVDLRSSFADSISSLNYVVLVLILCAALLAFIVLYNLTNVNVTERIRELATLKVLGLYDKEITSYIYRETIVLTSIGILFGMVLGIFLHSFVITTSEISFVMFGRTIKPLSYLFSALLTVIFSAIVNLFIHYRLKKIDMIDSLKSGE